MRLNNKGFAISSVLYSILIMAIMLILGVLIALSNRKVVFDKLKHDIEDQLNNNIPLTLAVITLDPYLVQITTGVTYNVMQGVTAVEINNGVETDITNNVMYRIYDSSGNDVTSSFSTSTVGEYIIRYDVMDSNNNMAQTKIRNLTINNIVVDHSGNNFNGTLKNGATLTGGGLTLDGVDDYVELPTLPSTINWQDGITIEFSAKWDVFQSWSRIFDFGNAPGVNNVVISNSGTTSDMSLSISNDTGTALGLIVGTAYTTKNTYKIEIIKDTTNYIIKRYLNGTLLGTNSYVNNNYLQNTNRIYNYIGKSRWTGDAYFDGTIYSLKITAANGTKIIDFNFTS